MKPDLPTPKQGSFLPSADLPIDDPRDDKLDRNRFAAAVARTIRHRMRKDSFVFALYGSWGSGKTSVANLVVAHLNNGMPEGDRIPVVRFNPWLCSDERQMASLLFLELGRAAVWASPSEEAARRSAIWEKYRAFLSVASSTLATTAATLEIFEVPLAGLLKALGEAGKKATALPEEAGKAAREGKTEGIVEIKAALAVQLASLPAPILVVVDDIDRLRAVEVIRIFQLIKANGDFPNVIYLLLFQRDIVEKNLDEHSPGTGAEFLKKIVQEGLDIPSIRPEQIKALLCEECERILQGAWPEAQELLGDHDQNSSPGNPLFGAGAVMMSYFRTIRDVWRFLNGLDFRARLLGMEERAGPMAHGGDLFALEVLRLFEPAVYQELAAKRKFLHPLRSELGTGDARENYVKVHVGIMSFASPENPGRVATILGFLYPYFIWGDRSIFSVQDYVFNEGDKWRGRLRHPACSSRFFEFRLDDDASVLEGLRSLRRARMDRGGVKEQVEALLEEGKLTEVVLAFTREIDLRSFKEPLNELIYGLCDAGDSSPEIRKLDQPIYGLVIACFNQTSDPNGILRNIERTERILAECPQLDWLTYLWLRWGHKQTVRKWASDLIGANEAVMWGLLGSCAASYDLDPERVGNNPGIHLKWIRELGVTELLTERLHAGDEQKQDCLPKYQKDLKELFFSAIERENQ